MSRNNWTPVKTSIDFFKDTLISHSKVFSCQQINYQTFLIKRVSPLSEIVVLVTDVYTVGQADVVQALRDVPNLNCIVTVSNWNGYTREGKKYARQNKIGLFLLSEFLGSLWHEEFWDYVKQDNDGKFIYHYREKYG